MVLGHCYSTLVSMVKSECPIQIVQATCLFQSCVITCDYFKMVKKKTVPDPGK